MRGRNTSAKFIRPRFGLKPRMRPRQKLKEAAAAVIATFATLAHDETAATLRAQGITREHLIPPEFAEAAVEKVANAWKHQHPRRLLPATAK